MTWRLWLYVASVFGLIPLVITDCTPQHGHCCNGNDQYASDTTVYSASALNCSFGTDLCCYRQKCADSAMSEWNAESGYATVNQTNLPGANTFSVLESPVVNVTTPSCVEFNFSRGTPYLLEVFLAVNNGTPPSLVVNSINVNGQNATTLRFTVDRLVGKIQFRVRGGGAPATVSTPKLYFVRIIGGNCSASAHPPVSDPPDPTTCKVGLPTSAIQPASSPRTHSASSTSAPANGTPSSISTGHSSSSPTSRSVPSQSSSSSRTVSSAVSSSPSGGEVAPSSVPTYVDSSVSSARDTMTASDNVSTENGDSDTNVGVIAGASIAAVVVAVVIFVVIYIVFKRKRHSRKDDCDERSIIGRPTPLRDGDYVNIDATGSPTQTTVFTAEVTSDDPHPSELAEDGTPGKTRNSLILSEGASHSSHYHQPNGTLDGDYSRVDDVQRPAADSSGKNDAQATQDCKDVYSVVNKPGRKPTSPTEYSLAKIVDEKPALPNPNDVYSVVNKKGKKPTIAPKPGTSDAEYNITSHTGRSTTTHGTGDATADTYNRIGAVPSLGPNGRSPESTKVGTGSAADDYNTLDFADARQSASRKEKSGAYDHVSNNPDDSGYSKTRIGDRNVVIDSEYNHLQA